MTVKQSLAIIVTIICLVIALNVCGNKSSAKVTAEATVEEDYETYYRVPCTITGYKDRSRCSSDAEYIKGKVKYEIGTMYYLIKEVVKQGLFTIGSIGKRIEKNAGITVEAVNEAAKMINEDINNEFKAATKGDETK